MAARTGKSRTRARKGRGGRQPLAGPPPRPAAAPPVGPRSNVARRPGHPAAPAVVRETPVAPGVAVPAGLFKATCLELMDRVQAGREEIVITKYGKPVAKLVPVEDEDTARRIARGWMKGTVLWYGDVISPIDVEWEAMKD